jgi:diguanylate cyclase (GGDEF)-like protein
MSQLLPFPLDRKVRSEHRQAKETHSSDADSTTPKPEPQLDAEKKETDSQNLTDDFFPKSSSLSDSKIIPLFQTRLMYFFSIFGFISLIIAGIGNLSLNDYEKKSKELTQLHNMKQHGESLITQLSELSLLQTSLNKAHSNVETEAHLNKEKTIAIQLDNFIALLKSNSTLEDAIIKQLNELSTYRQKLALDAEQKNNLKESTISANEALINKNLTQKLRFISNSISNRIQQYNSSVESNIRSLHWQQTLAFGLVLLLLTATILFNLAEQKRQTSNETELEKALLKAKSLANHLRQLSELGELLQSCRSSSEAMMMLRSAIPPILGTIAGTVFLLDNQRRTVSRAGAWGTHLLESHSEFTPDDCWAIRRNQVFPSNESQHGICCSHLDLNQQTSKMVHHLCVPLAAQGEALGMLYLDSPSSFSRTDRRMCRSVAEQLSLSLANLQLQESLRLQSLRDSLTGLFNRRYLDASLPREISRSDRRRQSLSMLMIDIDHFKNINDTYGHDAGDMVLTQVASTLKRLSREEDIVCRHGGEEFVLIMPDVNSEAAFRRAEQLRETIAGLSLRFQSIDIKKITVSIGISSCPAHANNGDQLRLLADKALYDAKRSGRNRTIIAPLP